MWKKIRSLELQLAVVNDARHRTEMFRLADAQARKNLEDRLHRFAREISEREGRLLAKDMALEDAHNQLRMLRKAAAVRNEMLADGFTDNAG